MSLHAIETSRWTAIVSLTLGLGLAPSLPAEERPLDGDPVHGALLFKKHCASCHGKRGRGAKGPRLTDGGVVNAVSDAAMMQMLYQPARGHKLHGGVKKALSLLDTWDLIGFLRSQVPRVGDLFPKADRYIVKSYTLNKHGLARLRKSTGTDVKKVEARVFTLFDTGAGGELELVPQDPRLLDRLKRRMKVGYVVFLPFDSGKKGVVELAVALEPKQLSIARLHAVEPDGHIDRDLNKLLSRFEGKGDRRLSGRPSARLRAGGGGRQIKALESQITQVYLRAAELATAYEVEERERSWADDDVELEEPEAEADDDGFSVK